MSSETYRTVCFPQDGAHDRRLNELAGEWKVVAFLGLLPHPTTGNKLLYFLLERRVETDPISGKGTTIRASAREAGIVAEPIHLKPPVVREVTMPPYFDEVDKPPRAS
jgi:hypothetical protein